MEPETKPGQSETKPEGLAAVWSGDFFEHGLEKFDETPPAKPEEKGEKPCTTCGKDKKPAEAKPDERKPFKILKVKGQEIPVYSKQELVEKLADFYGDDEKTVDLAQMAADYQRKTQGLAEGRSGARFTALEQKMDSILGLINQSKGEAKAPGPVPEVKPEPEKTAFEEFGLDPELADDWQKNMVTRAYALQKENRSLQEKFSKIEPIMQMMVVDKLFGMVQNKVKEVVKDFPIEDIVDEGGKSLTQAQFSSLLVQKAQADPSKPLDELAAEAVMEIHEAQQRVKASGTEAMEKELVTDDMDIEEFRAKHPALFARLAEKGVGEYLAKKEDLPPTPRSRGKEVNAGQNGKGSGGKGGATNLSESLDAGFADPDFLNNI